MITGTKSKELLLVQEGGSSPSGGILSHAARLPRGEGTGCGLPRPAITLRHLVSLSRVICSKTLWSTCSCLT